MWCLSMPHKKWARIGLEGNIWYFEEQEERQSKGFCIFNIYTLRYIIKEKTYDFTSVCNM